MTELTLSRHAAAPPERKQIRHDHNYTPIWKLLTEAAFDEWVKVDNLSHNEMNGFRNEARIWTRRRLGKNVALDIHQRKVTEGNYSLWVRRVRV